MYLSSPSLLLRREEGEPHLSMRCGGSPSEELASGSHPPVVVPPLEGEGPPRREHPLIQVCRLLLKSKPATQELGQLTNIHPCGNFSDTSS